MTAPTLDPAKLRRVFEQELQRGCANDVVIGGLDRMLIQMSEDGLLRGVPALGTEVRGLPPGGYRALAVAERRDWLRRAIAEVAAVASSKPSAATAQPRRNRPRTLTAGDPIDWLPGVTRSIPERLARLGVETIGDAATLYPRRFNDFSDVRTIAALEPSSTPQTVVGEVFSARQVRYGRRVAGSEAIISDGSGTLKAMWFNQPFVARAMTEGAQIVLSGRVRLTRGRLQMDNPEWELSDPDSVTPGGLVPVYPATQGLGQRTIRRVVRAALDVAVDSAPDPVPAYIGRREGLAPIGQVIRTYHNPSSAAEAETARQRLALGEFMAVQGAVLQRRREWQAGDPSPRLGDRGWKDGFLGSLPFELTRAQHEALNAILDDIGNDRPMLRLLQGDVGSGKTVVAFAAMLAAVASGYQAALMAPTEILAEQHYRGLARLLGGDEHSPLAGLFAPAWLPRPLRVMLLTGSLSAGHKAQIRGDAAHLGIDIIIGTHTLIEAGVELPRLGLAVVDEQHRFGVTQREKLRGKGLNPHLLVMTATPIPRTLALTVYGDLDSSVIDEMPPGRAPIKTRWVTPKRREDAYAFIRKHLDAGEQCFVICPLVEGSDTVAARSAEEEFLRLSAGPLHGYRIELLHGRMPGKQKDEVMGRFSRGETQVLVSTSVIEVGIDVPNATVIVIEGAERFGLSQLHQFRGRVGRSSLQSYCFLFSTEDDPGPDATERLEAMVETTDGFRLAEVDLAMRGEGETWGRLQSGANTMLRVARITDRGLLVRARELAGKVLERDPDLTMAEHRGLAALVARFKERAAEAN